MKLILKSGPYLLIFLLLAITLTACFNDGSIKSLDAKSARANLKILSMDFGTGMASQLGSVFQGQMATIGQHFQLTHPNVKFTNITYNPLGQSKSFQEFVDQEKPDILLLDETHYNLLAVQGKLLPLDIFFRDGDQAPEINPAVIDHLKALGNGQLYGLTPFFDNLVLYYNKIIFDKYKVPYPNEKALNWESIFKTAELIHTLSSAETSPVYGLYQSSYGSLSGGGLFQLISKSGGVNAVDPVVTNHTLESLINSYRSESISLPTDVIDPSFVTVYATYKMMREQAAMTIEGRDFLSQWRMTFLNTIETEFPWGIVKLPDAEGQMTTNKIFAINQQSVQQEVAWEFLKYIHQSETIHTMTETDAGFELPTVAPNLEAIEGVSLDPFYNIQGNSKTVFIGHDTLWKQRWNTIFVSAIQEDIGRKSTKELIKFFQNNLDEILQ